MDAAMKKTTSQLEVQIPANDRRNSNQKKESMKIVGIDVSVDWNDESYMDRLGTPCARNREEQLDYVAEDLEIRGYKVLWCDHRYQFHMIVPEDQEKEAYYDIEKAVRKSWEFQQYGALIQYDSSPDIQDTLTCHERDCELIALLVPTVKKRLIKLVGYQNKKRQRAQEMLRVEPNSQPIKRLMLPACNPD
jgi:hypothetical protein